MMIGNTTPLAGEELSSRQAAQRKSVSMATIRNWAKSGKISARKEKGRYIIIADERFEMAQKYQRYDQEKWAAQISELQQENARLFSKLQYSDQCYHELALLYDAALERAENVEAELAQYKAWEVMIRCPEAVDAYLKRNFPEYYRNEAKQRGQKAHNNWLPPLDTEENSSAEIVYEPNYNPGKRRMTIEAEVVSVKTGEGVECE